MSELSDLTIEVTPRQQTGSSPASRLDARSRSYGDAAEHRRAGR